VSAIRLVRHMTLYKLRIIIIIIIIINMRFMYTKIYKPQRDRTLCEVLSQFPQHVLPLPCNACISVTSEHRESNSITVSHNYRTLC